MNAQEPLPNRPINNNKKFILTFKHKSSNLSVFSLSWFSNKSQKSYRTIKWLSHPSSKSSFIWLNLRCLTNNNRKKIIKSLSSYKKRFLFLRHSHGYFIDKLRFTIKINLNKIFFKDEKIRCKILFYISKLKRYFKIDAAGPSIPNTFRIWIVGFRSVFQWLTKKPQFCSVFHSSVLLEKPFWLA